MKINSAHMLVILSVMLSRSALGLGVSPKVPARVATDRGNQAGADRDAQHMPFELASSVVFVQVRINESDPLWFVLDSGSDNSYISVGAAKALGLRLVKTGEGAPVAGGSVQESVVRNVSVSVAGVRLQNQTILAGSFFQSFEPVIGHRWDGILGGDFIRRFVVEIDYEARVVTLSDSKSFQYRGRGEVLPIKLIGTTPAIRGKLVQSGQPPVEGYYAIDTGGSAGVALFGPFIKKHSLIDRAQKTISVSAPNIGGQMKALIGRVTSLQLGQIIISNPIAGFSRDATFGGFDGNIGGEVLSRFSIILDYSRRRVILEPNQHFAEPYEYNMSGMRLVAEGKDGHVFKVSQVMPNSPAAEAGLGEGDVLTGIDGQSTTRFTLGQLNQMLKVDGREYQLRIERDGNTMQIRIKLRRLI